ncbi:MAG: hypothetical protein GX444_11420 [Myxococcales bacterium]|nr:hypothetical protein [Myxococcales bacterium]
MKRFPLSIFTATILLALALANCMQNDDDDDSSAAVVGQTDAMDEYEQTLADSDALIVQHGEATSADPLADVSTYCDRMDEQMNLLADARSKLPADCPGEDGHGGMVDGQCCPWDDGDIEHLIEHESELRQTMENYQAQCGAAPPDDETCAVIRDEHVAEARHLVKHIEEYTADMRTGHAMQCM